MTKTKFMKWTDPHKIFPRQKVYAIAAEYDVALEGRYRIIFTNKHRVIFDADGNTFCVFKLRRMTKASHPGWLLCLCPQENPAHCML